MAQRETDANKKSSSLVVNNIENLENRFAEICQEIFDYIRGDAKNDPKRKRGIGDTMTNWKFIQERINKLKEDLPEKNEQNADFISLIEVFSDAVRSRLDKNQTPRERKSFSGSLINAAEKFVIGRTKSNKNEEALQKEPLLLNPGLSEQRKKQAEDRAKRQQAKQEALENAGNEEAIVLGPSSDETETIRETSRTTDNESLNNAIKAAKKVAKVLKDKNPSSKKEKVKKTKEVIEEVNPETKSISESELVRNNQRIKRAEDLISKAEKILKKSEKKKGKVLSASTDDKDVRLAKEDLVRIGAGLQKRYDEINEQLEDGKLDKKSVKKLTKELKKINGLMKRCGIEPIEKIVSVEKPSTIKEDAINSDVNKYPEITVNGADLDPIDADGLVKRQESPVDKLYGLLKSKFGRNNDKGETEIEQTAFDDFDWKNISSKNELAKALGVKPSDVGNDVFDAFNSIAKDPNVTLSSEPSSSVDLMSQKPMQDPFFTELERRKNVSQVSQTIGESMDDKLGSVVYGDEGYVVDFC